jgi:hypothetical protein
MPDTMLIAVYLFVCEQFKSGLWQHVQRFSNNMNPEFTDEEVMTIYLFGIIQKRRNVKDSRVVFCTLGSKGSGHDGHPLLGEQGNKHALYVLPLKESVMSKENQFLNESLSLLATCFPDGFGGDGPSFQ